MPPATNLDSLLRKQSRALGRHLKPTEIFRRTMRRHVHGRLYSEVVRRLAPPDRIRDDVLVNGSWRFSEGFDGQRAWYRDKDHRKPTQATGRALAAERWAGTCLDHLRPLGQLKRLGCTLRDCGLQSTTDGRQLPAIQVSMLDYFIETIFLDDRGRIVAHRWELPEAGEDEQELEVRVDDWGLHDGLVHPIRSTVLDRRTGETVAEILVTDTRLEPYSKGVFHLTAD